MLINIIKFIHLLITLSLFGATLACLCWLISRKTQTRPFLRLNKIILWLAIFAMLTGTLLVLPKHFTFHTPWIQAAYLLLFIFSSIIGISLLWKNTQQYRGRWIIAYCFLLFLLVGITHDAVMKTTFLGNNYKPGISEVAT